MKLLEIAHRLPYPPDDGGKKGIFGFTSNFARILGKENFGLICMAQTREAGVDLTPLRDTMQVFKVFYRAFDNSPAGIIWNTISCKATPYNISKYKSHKVLTEILSTIEEFQPDVIQFEHLHTAWYAKKIRQSGHNCILSLREHNVESTIIQRLAANEQNPLKRALFSIQARKLYKYEKQALKEFDLVMPITSQDSERLTRMDPKAAQLLVPVGTEIPETLPASTPQSSRRKHIVHVSAMGWMPNQEGLRWFIGSVMPLLRESGVDMVLDVVGKETPESFHKLSSRDIIVHGFVPDLSVLFEKASLAVVPLQVGGGMRVKILEYMAAGVAVISTSMGAEGISNGSDGSLLIADDPESFAREILRVMNDEELREDLRQRAFEKCKKEYGWQSIIEKVLARYAHMLESH